MRTDYFADLVGEPVPCSGADVPAVPDTSPLTGDSQNHCGGEDVPAVPTVPAEIDRCRENEDLNQLPLAAKLRAYGEPWPLYVNGEIACWLVPDDEAADRSEVEEPVYTAEEVEALTAFDAKQVQNVHKLKMRFPGTKMTKYSRGEHADSDKKLC